MIEDMEHGDVVIPVKLPRSALTLVAPLPELLSQRNVEASLGVPKRAYLDALRSFRASGGVVTPLGKLRLVDRTAFVSWLRSSGAPRAPASAEDVTPTADSVLADLGYVRGSRR